MTNTMRLLGGAGITALFLLLLKLSSKANLKKKDRSCQLPSLPRSTAWS